MPSPRSAWSMATCTAWRRHFQFGLFFLFTQMEQPQAFPDDLAGVAVVSGLYFFFDETVEAIGEIDIAGRHGYITALVSKDCQHIKKAPPCDGASKPRQELELEPGAERQDSRGEHAVEDAHRGLVDQLAGSIPLQARADTVELGGVEHVVCLELNAQTAALAEDREEFRDRRVKV